MHTNKHVEHPPKKIPRGRPLPFFPFYFPFSFGSELAGGRAGGRGFPFLGFTGPVRSTTRGREPRPGSPTGAIAHTPPGPETRTVEALPGDGGRPPGRKSARAREGKGKEGTKDGGPCMCCSRCICCYRKKRNCCGCHRSSSCAVWFGLVCFLVSLVLFLDTGDHGWVAGGKRAGRRGAKNSEEFRSLMRNS